MTLLIVMAVAMTTTRADITGSAHNFSGKGWGSSEICIFCHTPHNAASPQLAPLWNHSPTLANFTLYSSSTLHNTPGQPGNESKACLSCHDGSVAIDSFGSRTGAQMMSGGALIGVDLSNDHPIGITMYHDSRDGALRCQNCHNMHLSPSMISPLPFFSGKVECATCHDPHNKTPGNSKLLRKPITGSELCLHCHAK
ncbi:MAG TPA: cytochrome c3 family protein [Candidatus Paceibacterota bacterium]|nr:cytochrome c3 family protein [Candidatus Paceibacterota bacterium]